MNIERRPLVGGGSFQTVDHLTVSGSQREIGGALAAVAAEIYGWKPVPTADRDVSRARRAWFQRHWPQHYERMAGIADHVGADLEADAVHLDGIGGIPVGSACSALWMPPASTAGGHGLIGRNYDFFTYTATELFSQMSGEKVDAPDGEAPLASRPAVVTCLPDEGYASTFITMNDLSGCMDGINEHGLAVTLLIADAENVPAPDESAGPQVGVDSLQAPRYLLDTCRNVDEAKQALLGAKYYDYGSAIHYLIADASGEAFVWERGSVGDEHIVRAEGAMCVTNYLLHRHPLGSDLPEDNEETLRAYERSERLQTRFEEKAVTGERIREMLDDVRFNAGNAGAYPTRTLWRTVFDTAERTLSTHFYKWDDEAGQPVHSEEFTFKAG
ncbi:C45 family autoproteolytic acyltransferase/hydolase [Salininema proteolyticum]|uniref:C45 family autoproteolytic acyltransferase/hydrolase n=1 Tax=Salininema proteolyticum TaxID=1607685 RepID=A0ABV8U565_9ACTN